MNDKKRKRVAPGISFGLKWSKIMIFHKTIVALENPKYIFFMLNLKKKQLAVVASNHKTRESFKVPEYLCEEEFEWCFKICSQPLVSHIYEYCAWNPNTTYRIDGIVYPEQRLVEFNLNTATSIE